MTSLVYRIFFACALLALMSQSHAAPENTNGSAAEPTFDLSEKPWGQAQIYTLDGAWNAYWHELLTPEQIRSGTHIPMRFPVPGVWGRKSTADNAPPALGYMTYHATVALPDTLSPVYLYIPDMPSAYRLWANGEVVAKNGIIGFGEKQEVPVFLPKVVEIKQSTGTLDLVIQLSNYHYREGGIWFSLKLTDQSGRHELYQKPLVWTVFFATVLIVIGLYNLSMFAFRRQEIAALFFGMLCLVVGLRRLLIDERIIYMFDWFSWSTLQRVEHLCFYLTLPLFMGFFSALFQRHIPHWTMRVSWVLISPFVLICLFFSARIYTKLNVSFQMLVLISLAFTFVIYVKAVKKGGANTRTFGLSLLVLAAAATHDILKANGYFSTDNIAHFGVLAFVLSQALALQKRYMKSLTLVEEMSTQVEKRNRELLTLDEFKDEFLATTSHELRTPLQGITGLARVLREDAQNNLLPEQKKKIDLIASTTQRLSFLVNDILDFSSIKHGKLTLNPSSVDLNVMAELVLSTLKPTLNQKGVTLKAHIASNARYIRADAFRLQQVLFNLLGNSAKYTDKGEITLHSYCSDTAFNIDISDTGVGIPEDKQHALFKPFEQVHSEGHFSASGTGLGLSISRQLVELHNGHLHLSSRSGHGTCVKLEFPLSMTIEDKAHAQAPDYLLTICAQIEQESNNEVGTHYRHDDLEEKSLEQQTTTEAQHKISSKEAHRHLIFVVDDEQLNRDLLAGLLETANHRVENFTDGMSLLKRLTQVTPDLILIDYMMPGMNGIEVCRSIRQRIDHCELPIMLITARHQVSDIVAAFGAGANDYLLKPFHDKELVARVESQLSIRQYWLASQENELLKIEIERRLQLEEELSELNARLLSVLDASQDLVLLLNDRLNIQYANQMTREKFMASPGGMTGHSISEYISSELLLNITTLIDQNNPEPQTIDVAAGEFGEHWQITVKSIIEHAHTFYVLLISIKQEITQDVDGPETNQALAGLSSELTASRKHLEEIESALRKVIEQPDERATLQAISTDPAGVQPDAGTVQHALPSADPKEAISELLRLSLNLWERYSNKSKVDLAELSRCWRVYVDGTTVKTRTFDKYLSARSVPDRPRWRSVVRTANYVQANCDLGEADSQELSHQVRIVEDSFA